MKYLLYFTLAFFVFLASCNLTKNVPKEKYLLNNVDINNDTKVPTSDLETYLRQTPNNKLRLSIYNLSNDSLGWFNRQLRKLGQAPVIFSAKDADLSAIQLRHELFNMGYLDARVDTAMRPKQEKMNLTYNIVGGIPYRIREYRYEISDTTMSRIMGVAMERYYVKPLIAPGDLFNFAQVEAEMERVATVMRNVGYANFSKEYVYVKADTTLNAHQVDLFLDIYPSKDTTGYKRFKFNDVTIFSGYSADVISSNKRGRRSNFHRADTTNYKGLTIIRGQNNFLRNSTIYKNDYIKRGDYFSDFMLTNTYEAYTKMGAIKQINITTKPVSTDSTNLMDVDIFLVPAKVHWFRATLEGNTSAGDLGISPILAYQHQNLFNGSELLSVRLKGAYEFVGDNTKFDGHGSNYFEYGGSVGLKFPQFLIPWAPKKLREAPSAVTNVSIGINYQKRVQYTREFFNLGIGYGWNSDRNKLVNQFDLMNINYVRMPRASKSFTDDYLNNPDNPLIKETYKNQLIASTIYSGVWTDNSRFSRYRNGTVIRFRGEIAGVLPQLISSISRTKEANGDKKILGVAYAEYFKVQGEFAQTLNISQIHSVAYRVSMGFANPFGNSTVLPFEQRFFGGGPNGVRGWQTRRLGPGSYKPEEGKMNFVNQTGDISLILSIEDRHKLTNIFSFATFVDAGNIWTVRNYEGQQGGLLKLKNFYKEIAISYGVGIRFDMQFIIRLDLGIQLYDPARDLGDRWVAPALRRMAPQFGIGYPF